MHSKLINFKKRYEKKEQEQGVAMVIAVLIIMIMVALVTFMSAYAVRAIQKGTNAQELNQSLNAADTAVANMMTMANSSANKFKSIEIEKHLGVGNAVYGSFHANERNTNTGDGSYSWRWYAEKELNASAGTSYKIHATGYKKSPEEANARNIEVRIEATTVERIAYTSSGTIDYVATAGGAFSWAALSIMGGLELKNNAKIYEYDSNAIIGYPTAGTLKSNVATNKSFVIGSNNTVGSLVFLQSASSEGDSIISERCSGVGCSSVAKYEKYNYGLSLAKSREEVLEKCPNATYPDWVASANSATIAYSTTPKCYNNIIFDVDTSLPVSWTTGNPAMMYAKGGITINSGVEVGKQNLTSQGPYALRIFSSGTANFTMNYGTSTDPTKLTGVVSGMGLTCDIGKNAASSANVTAVYGSIACGAVTIHPYAQIWWDKQLEKSLKEGSANAKKIWNTTSYEEK